jgi:hypothetical protein
MRWGILATFANAIIVGATLGISTTGQAAGLWEKNFWMTGPRYDKNLPLCHEHGPLDRIVTHFDDKERKFWDSKLELVGFENIREIAFEPWPSGMIPRRFCSASVLVSDGKRHEIYYSIIEDGGILGATYGVEWCVVGIDRNWAYNPACRMARP